MRKPRAVLVIALVCAGVAVAQPIRVTHAAPARGHEGGAEVDDPELLDDMHDAESLSERTGEPAEVTVELLTDHTAALAQQVVAAGGAVTGSVPGQVVQAVVPVGAVDDVAALPSVEVVRHPQRAGYVPSTLSRTEGISPGFGTTVGSEVVATNAAAWHAVGQQGLGVRVGIIDFFDFTVWNPDEQGTPPDPDHQFCLDSTGTFPSLCDLNGTISSSAVQGTDAGRHGVAVAEIVRDMAPAVELYVATVGTVSDLSQAVGWMADHGVTIVSRSLGAAYDGPGDGTGPLATVVDNGVARGLTWFNSGGNDGFDAYVRRSVPTTLAANGYVNWNDGRGGAAGPAVADTWLRIDADNCYFLDGLRWANDWYLPAAQRTDYRLEVWAPDASLSVQSDHFNPAPPNVSLFAVFDSSQIAGAPPLEGADQQICVDNNVGPDLGTGPLDVTYIRVKRNAGTPVGAAPDQLEFAVSGPALTELGYSDAAFSAAKPVVDSKNPGLVAVGAVDPPPAGPGVGPYDLAFYSSQGPTNDLRVKPDVTAPSGFASTVFGTFSGTSAAAPTAAGVAALLQGAGLAAPGAPTAALVKHFVRDLGLPGPDNGYGTGIVELPAPPTPAPAATPSRFVPVNSQRVLDTRQGAAHVGPTGTVGPFAPQSIFEFNVPAWSPVPADAVAVAVNITSVAPPSLGFVQASPYLRARTGGTSTVNLSTVGLTRPNFAIVPIGQDGNISVYVQAGGDVIIDVLGYYLTGVTAPADGRFLPLALPDREMDTRIPGLLPVSFGSVARPLAAGETVTLPGIGAGLPSVQIAAVVMTVAAVGAQAPGFLRVYSGATVPQGSSVNYVPGAASSNTVIVPLGAEAPQVFSSQSAHVVVDVIGYITGPGSPASTEGTFVPLTPTRAYDTRPIVQPFTAGEVRPIVVTGGGTGVPDGIGGVSANFTVVAPAGNGFLQAYPGAVRPLTATANYAAGKTVATGTLMGVAQSGVSNSITAAMSQSGHLIIDINGYFVAAPS